MSEYKCFFEAREDAGGCSGQLVRAHLIKRQVLTREFKHGCVYEGGQWWPLERGEDQHDLQFRSLDDLISDERSWVAMCGGPMGDGGHHGVAYPDGWQLVITREELPESFVEFCEELGLGWYIQRTYPAVLKLDVPADAC